MGLKLRALSRYRPRMPTLAVSFLAAAMIALANLSFDEAFAGDGGVHYRSYGWPLVWHRLVLSGNKLFGSERAVGWFYSLPRLAANLAVWLLLWGALAGMCEWLLRRYRPRPRWSLRTLLAFVALAAMFFAWYAHARNRAAMQDPLIPLTGGYGVPLVFVERWGPKWLDLMGLDHLRRRIVLANYWSLDSHEPTTEQRFLQLARLRDVRHLTQFHVDELNPTTAKALGGMQLQTLQIELERLTPDVPAALAELRELRSLSIGLGLLFEANDHDARLADECLAAIGNMTRLESLRLSNLPLHGKSLACLSGLTSLKSLDVDFWNGEWTGSRREKPISEDCLRAISTLTQLEWLRVEDYRAGDEIGTGTGVRNESLACLINLTNLRTLIFDGFVTKKRPMLAHLPPLTRLESLKFSDANIEDDDLARLDAFAHLKSISLGSSVYDRQPSFTVAGLASLASVGALEDVQLAYDIVPDHLEALHAIRGLKRLHLWDSVSVLGDDGILVLDDGKELRVRDLDAFHRALRVLRQARPGIVIDTGGNPVFFRPRTGRMANLSAEAIPHRPTPWLPGGDTMWMTPQELADFGKSGGRASFYGATFPDRENKGLITIDFYRDVKMQK